MTPPPLWMEEREAAGASSWADDDRVAGRTFPGLFVHSMAIRRQRPATGLGADDVARPVLLARVVAAAFEFRLGARRLSRLGGRDRPGRRHAGGDEAGKAGTENGHQKVLEHEPHDAARATAASRSVILGGPGRCGDHGAVSARKGQSPSLGFRAGANAKAGWHTRHAGRATRIVVIAM